MAVDSDLAESLNQILDSSLLFFDAFDKPAVNFKNFDVSVLWDQPTQKLSIVQLLQNAVFLLVFDIGFAEVRLLEPVCDKFFFGWKLCPEFCVLCFSDIHSWVDFENLVNETDPGFLFFTLECRFVHQYIICDNVNIIVGPDFNGLLILLPWSKQKLRPDLIEETALRLYDSNDFRKIVKVEKELFALVILLQTSLDFFKRRAEIAQELMKFFKFIFCEWPWEFIKRVLQTSNTVDIITEEIAVLLN